MELEQSPSGLSGSSQLNLEHQLDVLGVPTALNAIDQVQTPVAGRLWVRDVVVFVDQNMQ